MLKKMLFCMLALMPFTIPVEAGFWDKIANTFWKPAQDMPPMVKVLVVHDKPGVIIEVKGKYKLYDPRNNEHISTRFIGKRKFMQPLQDGLRWGEEFPGLYQILIMPDDLATTTIVDGIEYRGAIYVYDIGGTISVVNEINIEDYLQSILARQFLEPLSEETLAALAISARTNAYAQAENPKSTYWAVDGRKIGYQGYAVTNHNTAIERAIKATRFLIMSRSGNTPDDAGPFMSQWNNQGNEGQPSRISVVEADEMAKKGNHAAQILNKAFPGISIVLMYSDLVKR